MSSKVKIFENSDFGEIRVAGTSDEPLFCLADVCRVLEIKNVSDCKSRLNQRGIVLTDTPTYNQHGKEVVQKMVYINESNLYRLIMRSDKPQAEMFQGWICDDVIPSIRKTGKYEVSESTKKYGFEDRVNGGLSWVKGLGEILRLNDSSKLHLLKQIGDNLSLPVPDYAKSKGVVKSATALLKENNIEMNTIKFNSLMVEKGLLETRTRQSKTKGEVTFRSLTEKGLQFGENLVSPKNPRETQPQYYVDKFEELLVHLGIL